MLAFLINTKIHEAHLMPDPAEFSRKAGIKICCICFVILILAAPGSSFAAAPANDNVANAIVISGRSGSVTGSNIGATDEPGEPVTGYNTTISVWWMWTPTVSETIFLDTGGSSFDTILAVFTAAGRSASTMTAINDDAGQNYTSSLSFQAISGTTYYIAAYGYAGSAGSIILNWRHAGSISGTVFRSDGVTPMTGKPIGVFAISDSFPGNWGNVNASNGTYTIEDLVPGTYYLWAFSTENFVAEWWAEPLSTRDVDTAQPIAISIGEEITGKNFQFDPGCTISGIVFQGNGLTPITGPSLDVYAVSGDPCDGNRYGQAAVNPSNGTYTITGLPPGSYYLQTASDENVVIDAWWAVPSSTTDCNDAQSIVVEIGRNITGKNFQLDTGSAISGTVYHGNGVTPVTGQPLYVYALGGNPCDGYEYKGQTAVDPSTGAYTITGLSPGTYYLGTDSINFSSEWWADPQSTPHCEGAQAVSIGATQHITGKNFQVDPLSTISGTVYHSDGMTPITGQPLYVYLIFSGDPCFGYLHLNYLSPNVDSSTGNYTITGLPPGTYYLLAASDENFIEEWWADSQSTRDCGIAQSIIVGAGQNITGRDFQLETGSTLSGTVYQSDGVTPVTGSSTIVYALAGSPCSGVILAGSGIIDPETKAYTILGLPAGTYYLLSYSLDNYIAEWWAEPQGTPDCEGAQSIVVLTGQKVIGKNFHLDTGGTISGTLYKSDGETPITGQSIRIDAYTGPPCGGYGWTQSATVDPSTGIFTLVGLPSGNYYLRAYSTDNNFTEWWAAPQSTSDCTAAQSVAVEAGRDMTDISFRIILKGDVNNDGIVDLSDAVFCLRITGGISPATTQIHADVNGDGKIGIPELIYILEKQARLR